MKRSLALMLCLVMGMTCLPLCTASAGDPGFSYEFFLPKRTLNADTLKLKAEVDWRNDIYTFHLKQVTPPMVRVTPEGEAQIPFLIGIKIFDNYLDDTKPTRRLYDEDEAQAYRSHISYMENSIFYFTLDAAHPIEPIKRIYGDSNTYFLPFYDFRSLSMEYDANGYTWVRDLTIILPESADYVVNEALSAEGLVYVNVQPGKALPADANFRFVFGEKKFRKAEKTGWFTYGKSKTYLPTTDSDALAAYPALKSACYITYQVVDKKAKVVHYGVLHGQWADMEQGQ